MSSMTDPFIENPSHPFSSPSKLFRLYPNEKKVGTLGDGTFGSVYKVRNRMDRRLYAIKAAKREARGQSDRDRMLREVYALAALSDDTSSGASGSSSDSAEAMRHVVRYYQAWMEGSRLYIQIELCQCTLLDEMVGGALAAGGEGGGGGGTSCSGRCAWR